MDSITTHLKVVRQAAAVDTPLKAARFKFHEGVLADTTLSRAAIQLAGYVMHKFEAKGGMSFSFSIRAAAKYLTASRGTVQRGMAQLEERGHLYRLDTQRINAKGAYNPKGRYAFGNPIKHTASEMSPGGPENESGAGPENESALPVKSLCESFQGSLPRKKGRLRGEGK
jgi:hypothetical protein